MSEELEKVRQHILDEIMEEIHIDRMLERMRREPDRIVISTGGKRYVITVEEEAQLAARNQAAEAMGVLERLVRERPPEVLLEFCGGDFAVAMDRIYIGKSLIDAVLKAGGE